MAFTPRNLTGSLFKNDRKTEDKHPDYTGSMMINGQDYYLDGWIKESKQGKKFISLSLKPKGERQQQAKPDPAKRQYNLHRPPPPPSKASEPEPTPDPETGEYSWDGDKS